VDLDDTIRGAEKLGLTRKQVRGAPRPGGLQPLANPESRIQNSAYFFAAMCSLMSAAMPAAAGVM
jgi:hypothetical protein